MSNQDLCLSSANNCLNKIELLPLINDEIKNYIGKLSSHPIVKFCIDKTIPHVVLKDFAKLQFVDSTLWVPMLALIKDKIHSPKLLKAVKSNLLCEAGANGISHVSLCQQFIESLGITPRYGHALSFSEYSGHPLEIMTGIQDYPETVIAGWLLIAESLVPTLFKIFKMAFENISNIDLRYLDEHITVDADEHALWMYEAVEELLLNEHSFSEIMQGIDIGGRMILCIPDILYSKTIRILKLNS